jgi:streptogramin lyase
VNRNAFALAFALAAAWAPSVLAETTPFQFDRAIYRDEKEGALKSPEGVACNDIGDLVVADSGNGRLVRYRYVGGTVSGGTELKPAGVAYPRRVQFDSKGNLYVLDSKARKVFKIDPKGAVVGTLEVKAGASALSTLPVAFKVDGADNVYVVDAVGARVVVFDPGGSITRQLELPKGVASIGDVHVDVAGTVFIVDGSQAAIWAAEKGATAFKPFAQGMKDKMNFPVYLTGSKGKLYVVDQNGHGIVVLGADGTYQGRQLSIGWSDGFIYYPSQLCMTTNGDAFLADRGNDRVQIFTTAR